MAEELKIAAGDKEDKYHELVPQARALVESEDDLIAALANLSAALAGTFNWLWTGFYLVKNGVLVLGPFQGPIACTRIPRGKGVCGASWAENRTLIVPDVEAFPGHIACSSLSRSEIVVPLRNRAGEVVGVLDVDSEALAAFDEVDARHLEDIVSALTHLFD
ncbi:GAF domain-containing protein [uncultured Aquitalea sp.]|uniref:GAF domain-containing protein n=1 Tax=uncultured Aquitalea sp. TaxID=540272 RepID=UPI0025ECEAA7|nr:GAF domain-containing protein [uncultured Aquitalea sp.]